MITINGEKRHLPFAPIRSGPWLGGVPWHNIGELEYGMEKFAGWVVPDVRENDLGKRSWDNMGRPPQEGCALVGQIAIGIGLLL